MSANIEDWFVDPLPGEDIDETPGTYLAKLIRPDCHMLAAYILRVPGALGDKFGVVLTEFNPGDGSTRQVWDSLVAHYTEQSALGTAFEALAAYAAARNNAQCAKSEAEVMDVTEASHE